MELAARVEAVKSALRSARESEAAEIRDAIARNRIVGVLGEAEVGKTETLEQALSGYGAHPLRLDFDSVASESHIAWLIARAAVVGVLGPHDASLLHAEALAPTSLRRRRLDLVRLTSPAFVDESQAEWPTGSLSLPEALSGLDRVAETSTELLVWIDHIETPLLTPRHPVSVDAFLWSMREMTQRHESIRLIVSCRSAAESTVLGTRAALHQNGRWFTLGRPSLTSWLHVAEFLGIDPADGTAVAQLLRAHPPTTLLAFLDRFGQPDAGSPEQQVRELAMRDDGLVARSVQHARTLHRLGSQVLVQIAMGDAPYGTPQRGKTTTAEISKVLDRLRLAGLAMRPRRGVWEIVNPLIGIRLRGTLSYTSVIGDRAGALEDYGAKYSALRPWSRRASAV
jgi:hypothetical protein